MHFPDNRPGQAGCPERVTRDNVMVQNQSVSQRTLDRLSTAPNSRTFVDARRMLNGLSPADLGVATLFYA